MAIVTQKNGTARDQLRSESHDEIGRRVYIKLGKDFMKKRNWLLTMSSIALLVSGCGGSSGNDGGNGGNGGENPPPSPPTVDSQESCSNYQYQEDAQNNYSAALDPDGDGIACNELPKRDPVDPTPPPSGAPSPAPSPIALQGGYPTANLECATGTPMKLNRRYSYNYNGGVFRFVPEGGEQRTVIWEISNLSTQQHSGSATFSAPTTDGRQAWMTVSRAGNVIGGGVHGATVDSYFRCGVATNGIERAGLERTELRCRTGFVEDDRSVTYTPQQSVLITYDFSQYPYVSMTAPPYINTTVEYGGPSSSLVLSTEFNGQPAEDYFYGNGTGYSTIVQNGKPVAFRKSPGNTPMRIISLECGGF